MVATSRCSCVSKALAVRSPKAPLAPVIKTFMCITSFHECPSSAQITLLLKPEQWTNVERMVFDGRTIDFMELQVFAAVARHGGVTAAADALGISKSTVSLQITRLEDRLGTRLLVRSSRRVALTREGEQVLPRVQSLLAEAENLLEEASRASAAPRGIVRIAVSPPLGGAMLELLVPALRDRYPDVSLIVVPSYEMDDLQDPSFDFAIRVGRIQDDTLIANKIGEFSRILVCAPSYPLAGANSVELLRKEDLLAFGGRVNQRKFAAQEHLTQIRSSQSLTSTCSSDYLGPDMASLKFRTFWFAPISPRADWCESCPIGGRPLSTSYLLIVLAYRGSTE
ncbi:DNA-binding transcriptional LysR family regulator [Bradyrhizobium japonicum]